MSARTNADHPLSLFFHGCEARFDTQRAALDAFLEGMKREVEAVDWRPFFDETLSRGFWAVEVLSVDEACAPKCGEIFPVSPAPPSAEGHPLMAWRRWLEAFLARRLRGTPYGDANMSVHATFAQDPPRRTCIHVCLLPDPAAWADMLGALKDRAFGRTPMVGPIEHYESFPAPCHRHFADPTAAPR